MNNYEIYWNDLSDEAKARLKPIYHSNINLTPLAIVEREENSEVETTHIVFTFDIQVNYHYSCNKVLDNEQVALMIQKIKEGLVNIVPTQMTQAFIEEFGIEETDETVNAINLVEEHTTHE